MSSKTNNKICISCITASKHVSRVNRRNSISINEARKLVLNYYKPICNCCGEDEILFLELDHVFNDGAEHRRLLKEQGIDDIFIWLVENDFPNPERYQILCANCNMIKQLTRGESL
jgi:hypothetical protein